MEDGRGFFVWAFSRWYFYLILTIFFISGYASIDSVNPQFVFGYMAGTILWPLGILAIPYHIKKYKMKKELKEDE